MRKINYDLARAGQAAADAGECPTVNEWKEYDRMWHEERDKLLTKTSRVTSKQVSDAVRARLAVS